MERRDIPWMGKKRYKKTFEAFFREIDADYLSAVKAVAMDMNASFNILIKKYLPSAVVVYDRFHMQAQFGRDILGVVCLNEAEGHQNLAKDLKKQADRKPDRMARRQLKAEAQRESREYKKLKCLRRDLLRKNDCLTPKQKSSLDEILESHQELAVCYTMKEEMNELFLLRDPIEARDAGTAGLKRQK